MLHTITVETAVPESFRVAQVAGMFDLPLAVKLRNTFEVELPDFDDAADENWKIGVIVGPSGSGKTTVARRVFGERLWQTEGVGSLFRADGAPNGETPTEKDSRPPWPADAAVIDGFGDLPTKDITHALTAVGLGSPPAWVRPHKTLSNGERFRCDLARALLCSPHEIVVFDEFTSVVDRTVAKIGSAAVAKAIRSGRVKKRFVAVTCHYDVIEWLEPDWTLDMATQQLARGCLWRRPAIEIEVRRSTRREWPRFARHHYLSGSLGGGARCYLATWEGTPVAFAATLKMFGFPRRRRVTRLVTLPDYQGIGVGARLLDAVCDIESEDAHRLSVTTSHPAMIRYCEQSPAWRRTHVCPAGARKHYRARGRVVKTSQGRAVVSFAYLGGGTP